MISWFLTLWDASTKKGFVSQGHCFTETSYKAASHGDAKSWLTIIRICMCPSMCTEHRLQKTRSISQKELYRTVLFTTKLSVNCVPNVIIRYNRAICCIKAVVTVNSEKCSGLNCWGHGQWDMKCIINCASHP